MFVHVVAIESKTRVWIMAPRRIWSTEKIDLISSNLPDTIFFLSLLTVCCSRTHLIQQPKRTIVEEMLYSFGETRKKYKAQTDARESEKLKEAWKGADSSLCVLDSKPPIPIYEFMCNKNYGCKVDFIKIYIHFAINKINEC